MIDPEHISDAVLQNFAEVCSNKKSMKAYYAAILNAAIEAGAVSPPCHYIRHNGKIATISGRVRLWPGGPKMDHHEHWKGQTE